MSSLVGNKTGCHSEQSEESHCFKGFFTLYCSAEASQCYVLNDILFQSAYAENFLPWCLCGKIRVKKRFPPSREFCGLVEKRFELHLFIINNT
jgi:hypothetical protein